MRGLLLSLVAFQALAARSLKRVKQHHEQMTAGCTENELLQLSIFLAAGPVLPGIKPPIPDCVPFVNQSIPVPWSINLADVSSDKKHVQTHSGSHLAISVKNSSHVMGSATQSKRDSPFFVHLLVVQSNEDWCKAPCNTPSWELSMPKPDDKDGPYALFEAAIWRQERRIALYRFDADWEKRARNTYHSVCFGKGWSCPAYRIFREGRASLKVGPWPAHLDQDGKKLSAWIGDAFAKVFAKIKEEEPQAQHFGMSYQGHGSMADGSLFEGSLNSADAAVVLRGAIGTQPFGTKFGLLNFGGNCNEGKWNMLAGLHWAAHWITASDLEVGGLNTSSLSGMEMQAMAEARTRLNDGAILMRSVHKQQSLEQIVADLIEGRKQLWKESWQPLIEKQNLAQSISAYKTDAFPVLAANLKKEYKNAPAEKQKGFIKALEKSDCDVLTGIRTLDPALETQFRAVVQLYASTKKMTKKKWKTDTNGLGFNFLGYRGPPCDLHLAVGAPKVEPSWRSGYASISEDDFEDTYWNNFFLKKHHVSMQNH